MSIFFEYTGQDSLIHFIAHRLDCLMRWRLDPRYEFMVDYATPLTRGVLEGLLFAHLITENQYYAFNICVEKAAKILFFAPFDDKMSDDEMKEIVKAVLDADPQTRLCVKDIEEIEKSILNPQPLTPNSKEKTPCR